MLAEVHQEFPSLRVLVVSGHDEAQYGVRSVRAGAAGFLSKSSAAEELVEAVNAVATTGRYLTDTIAAALLDQVRGRKAPPFPAALSDRELQVLALLGRGRTVTGIADELGVSTKTISTYRTRMMEKLGLHTTAEVIRYAIENRLAD